MAAVEAEGSNNQMWSELLETLFDANHERLYRLARRLSRDSEDARDLVQETFLRAARRPASIPMRSSEAEAWLTRILINLCKDRQRKRIVRNRPQPELVSPSTSHDPESALVAKATVETALARLAPRRRAVLVLYELEGVPVRRISDLLGVAQVTVRWHLAAARKEMARILTPPRKEAL
jgi:RNA polymerase sigma-70 factor (ECF subfamily)